MCFLRYILCMCRVCALCFVIDIIVLPAVLMFLQTFSWFLWSHRHFNFSWKFLLFWVVEEMLASRVLRRRHRLA